MTLEDALFKDIRNGREVDIERALLIASGCETEEKIAEYKAKIDELDRNFKSYASSRNIHAEIERARALHEFLWDGNPYRYKSIYNGGNFLLTDVINAQIINNMPVGNCVGLSLLYASLGLRQELDIQALQMPGHVALRVIYRGRAIDIEPKNSEGFGWRRYSHIKGLPPITLLASLLNNRIHIKRQMEDYDGEREDYGKMQEIYRKLSGESQ